MKKRNSKYFELLLTISIIFLASNIQAMEQTNAKNKKIKIDFNNIISDPNPQLLFKKILSIYKEVKYNPTFGQNIENFRSVLSLWENYLTILSLNSIKNFFTIGYLTNLKNFELKNSITMLSILILSKSIKKNSLANISKALHLPLNLIILLESLFNIYENFNQIINKTGYLVDIEIKMPKKQFDFKKLNQAYGTINLILNLYQLYDTYINLKPYFTSTKLDQQDEHHSYKLSIIFHQPSYDNLYQEDD